MKLKRKVVEGMSFYALGKMLKKRIKALEMVATEEDMDRLFEDIPELEDEYTMYLDSFGNYKYRPSVMLKLSLKIQQFTTVFLYLLFIIY